MEEKATSTAAGACERTCPLCGAIKAAHAVKDHLRRRVPDEFWQHRSAARREALLALRSLLDAALAHDAPSPTRKPTRIRVE